MKSTHTGVVCGLPSGMSVVKLPNAGFWNRSLWVSGTDADIGLLLLDHEAILEQILSGRECRSLRLRSRCERRLHQGGTEEMKPAPPQHVKLLHKGNAGPSAPLRCARDDKARTPRATRTR